MCRMCALLHDDTHAQHYDDINLWWRGEGTCISGSWRTQNKLSKSKKKKKDDNSSTALQLSPIVQSAEKYIDDKTGKKNKKKFVR